MSSYINITALLIWASSLIWVSSPEVVISKDDGELLSVISKLCLRGKGSRTRTFHTESMSECVMACYLDKKCLSVSYNTAQRVCYNNKLSLTSARIIGEYNEDCLYTEITGRIRWRLAFRATHGIGDSVFDAWNNVGHHDDVTTVTASEFGCMTVDGRLPCPKHFRSKRLDNFANIKRILFGFYTNSVKRFQVQVKIGSSTNATQTFQSDNFVVSNKASLNAYNESFNYFSAEGYPECQRRFYISQSHSGDCSDDIGWMMVNDGPGGAQCCSYQASGPFPQFRYAKTAEPAEWNNQSLSNTAQVFAVFYRY